ncbi:sugar phosphate isomerase/epimerase family protein [Cohnella nanjingensis]|uniref:Sugar phosphate isomerase/epimerase n=1 Tax=Cohnella nanjingensis TaxID=1387779 RepID=A0A7X0VEA3_9BACL|nr:sugar phosphate isomerase/epimerase [Cohnella nanjingensis]MBB6670795.1 sugar phosphate isomerase/epimerase [Cohnella nanjingensis]
MQLAIFAKTFSRPSVDEVLDAVKSYGIHIVQFNLACAGMPSMPDRLQPDLALSIGRKLKDRNISMAAISGTFNMAHPEEGHRTEGLKRLRVLASACRVVGTSIITLCTGTRNTENMWLYHQDNRSNHAWRDMAGTMAEALKIAEEFDITLALEPERSNIVSDAPKANTLLREMQSKHLRIVMDAANLFDPENSKPMNRVLEEAFLLLGEQIVIAHAKDVGGVSDTEFVAAGKGLLDYDHYLDLLKACHFHGPMILHGLQENQVEESVRFLKRKMEFRGNGGEEIALFEP